MILLLFIRILHFLLFISLLSSIFISDYVFKELALIILFFLLLQYITNYGKCTLTQLEYLIMGEDYREGFLYRLINPIINRDENYFNYYYYLFHILWIIILIYQLKKKYKK
jgi:hypothetical protein